MNWVFYGALFLCFLLQLAVSKKEVDIDDYQPCLDHKGKEVLHGDRFFPLGSDPCTQCTCLNGKPQMCIAVYCSPPENCKQYHALSDKCCEFVCLDRDFPNKASGNGTYPGKDDLDSLNTTNLGLRLVASTVTSFLVLALLLFMVHRIRQRSLFVLFRRKLCCYGVETRRENNANSHLSRRYSEDDDGSVGYFVGHDQLDFSRYDEPPPPYTLWKPPEMYIPPGEAPPPYDLSVQLTAPYTGTGRFSYAPADQVIAQQAIISVHAENHQASSSRRSIMPDVINTEANVVAPEAVPEPNCSLCTAADVGVAARVISSDRAVLPPDIQYEESRSYRTNCSVTSVMQPELNVISSDVREEDLAATTNIASTSSVLDDAAVPTTSACTCALSTKRGKVFKRHSCAEFNESSKKISKTRDKRFSLYPAASQENNNLYPDPTVWGGEVSESSSSSTPTYDQPTLSPSTSDSSSADADFPRAGRSTSSKSIPNKTASARDLNFDSSRNKNFSEDLSKPPHFQKTLSNLKKFSLIKRKKKKRRFERPAEISCSFVCQSVTDGMHPSQVVFEDGIDLTVRNSNENMARPFEAINPHIGQKLASSSRLRSQGRPTSIAIPGHSYRIRSSDGAGPSYLSYAGGASVVTVSRKAVDGSCPACCNASSPDSVCEDHRPQDVGHSSRSLIKPSISRSGSICSETGERRHHRSAGSSPSSLSRSNHAADGYQFSDARCASSSQIFSCERTRNNLLETNAGAVRHIPGWIANSVALASRNEYDTPSVHHSSVRRSASSSFGESSRSVGDITSPLDFRDSVHSSGSSWEACSHL